MKIDHIKIDLNGHELILRNATEDDAEILIEYLKATSGETRFLIREPEEVTMTLEQEKAFIKSQNASEGNVMLLGFLDGQFVGNCALNGYGRFRLRHRACLGIALYQKYTGMGIGKAMMKTAIRLAEEIGYEQIELEVVGNNERAIALYKKMGFEICGMTPKAMKYKDGTYADEYKMVKVFEKTLC